MLREKFSDCRYKTLTNKLVTYRKFLLFPYVEKSVSQTMNKTVTFTLQIFQKYGVYTCAYTNKGMNVLPLELSLYY